MSDKTTVTNRVGNAIRRVAAAVGSALSPRMQAPILSPVDTGRGWMTIFDWRPGAFQSDEMPVNTDRVMANWAVYACISLISGDLGKMRLKLVEKDRDGIWRETESAAFSPALKKPNQFQTRQKFIEQWAISKLSHGNTYVLKERDRRGLVIAMHVLDPMLVTPLVAPNGMVFYRVGQDWLAEVTEDMEAVPASEIIHDRAACLFHPLVGVSPIYACGLAAMQGMNIQKNSEAFFRNKSMPGGLLLAPGEITDATAKRLKDYWDHNFVGDRAGKTAVLGDGLKFEPMNVNPVDAQLVEQLKITATMICSAFHVPPFKIGIDTLPAGQKVEDMNRIYYADCLQTLIESCEALLDEGLGLDITGRRLGTEFDIDDLLRMDTPSQIAALNTAVGGGWMKPNEARAKRDLPPTDGGDECYLQQQYWGLSMLSKRTAAPDGIAPSAPPTEEETEREAAVDQERAEADARLKRERVARAEAEAAALIERVTAGLRG